jgi:hypothetical protein
MTGSLDVRALVDRVLLQDRDAWETFWCLIRDRARTGIAGGLRGPRPDPERIDEFEQEFYLHLQDKGRWRLQRFQGCTLPELLYFIYILARNFTLDRLDSLIRAEKRHRRMLQRIRIPKQAGVSEAEIDARFSALRARMPAKHRRTLDAYLGVAETTWAGSTLRHHVAELFAWCAEELVGRTARTEAG